MPTSAWGSGVEQGSRLLDRGAVWKGRSRGGCTSAEAVNLYITALPPTVPPQRYLKSMFARRAFHRPALAVAAPAAALILSRARSEATCAAAAPEKSSAAAAPEKSSGGSSSREDEPLIERVADVLDATVDVVVKRLGIHIDDDVGKELEEGPGRYAAYARRIAQVFLVKGRMIAYTSDLGESFRPVMPRSLVRMAYGITWVYVGVDVAFNTAEEHVKGSPPLTVLRTAVHALTFQSIASVLVPSIVIHQVGAG